MIRHKHADLIIAWAEGAEIEVKNQYGKWEKTIPSWNEYLEHRLKLKELDWWEDIPEHGILVRKLYRKESVFAVFPSMYISEHPELTPLTNEEIERFKR